MAKHFNESDIEEFRDCFYLFAREKTITSVDELTLIMRSLGFSPTKVELDKYFTKYAKDGKLDFATFLEAMHAHSQAEKCQQEIMSAFQAHDRSGQGSVPAKDLHHIMLHYGEKLSQAEVDRLFKEAKVQSGGQVNYDAILKTLLTPLPDY